MTNTHSIDRILRVLIGIALLASLYLYGQTTWTYVAAAVGAVLLLTAVVGFCPLYRIVGINTAGKA